MLPAPSVLSAVIVTCSVPLVGFVPIQLPEALQVVALVEDQLSVVVSPLPTVVGSAVSVTVGRTVTVTVDTAPPQSIE